MVAVTKTMQIQIKHLKRIMDRFTFGTEIAIIRLALGRHSTTGFIFWALPLKGGSTMRKKLEAVLGCLEKAAAIISVVVPATRTVVELLESPKRE